MIYAIAMSGGVDSSVAAAIMKQSTVHSPQSTVNSPQSTVHSQQSTVNSQQSTVNSQQSTISVDEVKDNWEQIKLAEKKQTRKSVLEGVPKSLPALIQASRIQEKAAAVGFDWDDIAPVFDKIYEEIDEVKEEIANVQSFVPNDKNNSTLHSPPSTLEDELGDLFFAVVNLARKLKIDSETALRKSNEKFKKRFQIVEKLAEERNINMTEVGLDVLDELWEIAKKL
jgi:tetrapyrrole methylase family protein/MazG family protein